MLSPFRFLAYPLSAALLCILSPQSSYAVIIYVDCNAISSSKDGKSWSTAFTDIETGIVAAEKEGGGEVWVAEGVYEIDETIHLGSEICLRGESHRGCVMRDESVEKSSCPILVRSANFSKKGGPLVHASRVDSATNFVFCGTPLEHDNVASIQHNRAESYYGVRMPDGAWDRIDLDGKGRAIHSDRIKIEGKGHTIHSFSNATGWYQSCQGYAVNRVPVNVHGSAFQNLTLNSTTMLPSVLVANRARPVRDLLLLPPYERERKGNSNYAKDSRISRQSANSIWYHACTGKGNWEGGHIQHNTMTQRNCVVCVSVCLNLPTDQMRNQQVHLGS